MNKINALKAVHFIISVRTEYITVSKLVRKITEYSFITNSNLLLIYLNSIRVTVTFHTHGSDRMNVLSEKEKKITNKNQANMWSRWVHCDEDYRVVNKLIVTF